MGYDMRIRGDVPPAPEHDIEQAKNAYEAAAAAYQKRIKAGEFGNDLHAQLEAGRESEELWDRWYSLRDPGYFRLGNYGMGAYAEAMLDLGMMHESTSPVDFKDYPEFPENEDDETAMAAYYAAADKLTGQHGDSEKPTIPDHKFSSNDGWHVTEEEIKAALEVWESHPGGRLKFETITTTKTPYWAKWIAWLQLAAEHGGFRVN